MFTFCRAMTKQKLLLLFILLLTDYGIASRDSRKHILPTEQNSIRTHPLIDQIALANTWQPSNRVISATYAGNPDTGHVNHANLVVSLLPRQSQRPSVDAAASEMLANARTAAEYVSRAMEMRNKHQTPHSSYVKYDVFEKEQTQLLPDYHGIDEIDEENEHDINQIEMPQYSGNPYPSSESVTRSSKQYSSYDYPSKRNHRHHNNQHGKHPTDKSFASDYQPQYDPDHAYDDPPYKVVEPPYGSSSADIPKSEIIKHIQHSVIKYMKELEVEGKLPATSVTSERPHTEVKTYYRVMPSSTAASHYNAVEFGKNKEKQRVHNTVSSTHSEYYAPASPPAHSYQSFNSAEPSASYHTSTIATPNPSNNHDEMTPESVTPHIDLTFRSKARPKPIDLAALDVGQTWSHNPDHHHTPTPPTTRHHGHRSTPKPKLHLNSQAYHEINSMTYAPDKDLLEDAAESYGSIAHHTPVRFRDNVASVGSSISVGQDVSSSDVSDYDSPLHDLQEHYRSPIHVVNGIAASNSYKFNKQQLKQMFGGTKNVVHHTHAQKENTYEKDTDSWQPSYPTASTSGDHGESGSRAKDHVSTTFHHNLPYDSYNPKYNNNPEGHGYQESYKPIVNNNWETSENVNNNSDSHRHRGHSSDMHASSTSTKSKRTKGGTAAKSSKGKKHGKRLHSTIKVKVKHHSRNLDTELRPPPAM